MSQLSEMLGISRQAAYQAIARWQRRVAEEEMALALLRAERQRHPHMGIRKIYVKIQPILRAWGIKMGRDRLFRLAREHGLLAPIRRNPRRTTHPGWRRFPNLLAEAMLTGPGQALVADITYIFTERGHRYLFVVMDAYSRYLVGWALSGSLGVEGALAALAMALQGPGPLQAGCIHHSDHGVQYTARAYQEALQQAGLRPSMGQVGNAYDNALAERVIGTLKNEYGIEGPFVDQKQAREVIEEAIYLYNHDRPHWSLGLVTPYEVHVMSEAGKIKV